MIAGCSSQAVSRPSSQPALRPSSTVASVIPSSQPSAHVDALIAAILQPNTDEAIRLIDSGHEVDSRDLKGRSTALYYASFGICDPIIVDDLVAHGADVNAHCYGGATCLMVACENGRAELVEKLLAAGADPNTRDDYDGITAMHVIALGGRHIREATLKIDLLMAAGADINALKKSGKSPLAVAREQKNNDDVVKYLESKGAK